MRVLMIEDNEDDYILFSEHLVAATADHIEMLWRDALSSGLAYLNTASIDVLLLDMGLPDSQGLETFNKVQAQFPALPIVVLSGNDNDEQAMEAVQHGAQDYLVKGQVTGPLLLRALRYAQERKSTQETLRMVKERYRAVVEDQTEMICRFNTNFRITFANHAYGELHHKTPEEMLGQSMLDVIPPNARPHLIAHVAGLTPLQPMGTYENRIVMPNGITQWFQWTDKALYDEAGSIVEIQAVGRDITQRKQAEEELARYREHLENLVHQRTTELLHAKTRVEAILDNSIDGILLAYLDTGIEQTNVAFNKLFACQQDDYLRKPLASLVQAEDHDRLITLVQAVIGDHTGRRVEIRVVRKDETTFEAQIGIGQIITEDAKGNGVVCSIHDITELKDRERQLRFHASLQENVTDAVIATDLDYKIQSWNRAAERIYGWRADEVIGKPFRELLHTQFASEEITGRVLSEFAARGYWSEEVSQQHKDGSPISIFSSVVMFKDDRDVPLGIVAINHDITERQRAQNALKVKMEEERVFQNYLKELHEITIELTRLDQVDDFYRQTIELGRSRLGFDRLALFLYNAERNVASGTFGTDKDGNLSDERHLQFTPSPDGALIQTILKVERFSFEEATTLYSNDEPFGVGWHAGASLWEGTKSIGFLVADNGLQHHAASKPQLDILALYALTVGTLLVSKQTQEALRQSEANLQVVMNSTSVGIIMVDRDGIIRLANSLAQQYGVKIYQHPLTPGTTRLVDLYPEDRAATEQMLQQVFAGQRIAYEFSQVVDSQLLTLDTRNDPIVTADGEVIGVTVSLVDVTERKRAEEALRESEEKFRLLLDAAPVATIITNQTGHITLVNIQAETLFGYGRDELVGQSVDILIPESVRDRHAGNRATYSARPHVRQMGVGLELFARRKDGSEFPTEIELSYIETHTGLLVMSFVIDVTERKERERQLRFHASLQENVTDAVIATDLNFRIQSWNRAAERIYGWRVDEVIGKPINDVLVTQYASNKETTSSVLSEFLDHGSWVGEVVQYHRDGRAIQMLSSTVRFTDDMGNPAGIVSVNHDITERKQAENALREQRDFLQQMIDNLPGLITVKDSDGRFRMANNLVAQVYATTPAEMIGKMDADFNSHQDEVEFFRQKDRESLESGQIVFIPEESVFNRYYQTSKVPLKNGAGVFDRLLVVSSDITEHKQAEEALQLAFEKEKELGELKSRFVSMASHEFRTPLATILAATETLTAYRLKLTDIQIEQRLDKIRDQVSHLKDIMEDVLQLARMQARRVEFEPVWLDLDAMCRSVIDEFESRPDITQRFLYSCDAALREVKLDRKLMRQIINNLLSNAIKYSSQGKTITLSLEYMDKTFVLRIRDEGIGIPETDLKHLFEPFHRAANVGTISGTGLGLTIVKESVELHGGTLSVESQVEQGTTFTVIIPVLAKG